MDWTIALQVEAATMEAMADRMPYTVIGWVDGNMVACIGSTWVTL